MSEVNRDEIAARNAGTELEDLQILRKNLLARALKAVAVAGLLAVIAGVYESLVRQDLWTIPFYIGAYALLLFVLFWKKAPYVFRALVLAVLLYVMGVVDFIQDGRAGSGSIFLLLIPFLISLLFSLKYGIVALVLATLTMGGFGAAFALGYLSPPAVDPIASSNWAAGVLILLMAGAFILASNQYMIPHLVAALAQSRKLTDELVAYRDGLETLVVDRTRALQRRTRQLEIASRVAREAAEFHDLEHLLKAMARLISENFGFYHTGIFLLDEEKRYAVLRAASSEGGQQMLLRGHRLRVGEMSVVGDVIGQGKPRIVLNAGDDAKFFDTPDLPGSRSEMVLPLRVRGETIGALDVQSTDADAFDEQDLTILQTLTDQIALAIANIRLFEELQERLETEQRAYGRLSREAWQKLFGTRQDWVRRYDPSGILVDAERWSPAMKQAVQTGNSVKSMEETSEILAVPIKVRGEVIGVLNGHRSLASGGWSPESQTLLETLTEQLGQALESARLYQDTQRRAAREQFVSEATAHMRETLDLETVLQTAIREMHAGLGLQEAEIRLGVDLLDVTPGKVQTGQLRQTGLRGPVADGEGASPAPADKQEH